MPGRDGTGPNGTGPNGAWACGRGRFSANGFRGMNYAPCYHRFRYPIAKGTDEVDDAVDELTALKANAAYLEMKLKEINKRIEALT